MAGKLPRAEMVCLALATLALSACAGGLKIGGWQIIKPKPPLIATRVEIERWHMVNANDAHGQSKTIRGDVQTLAIELESGRASFTDANGKVYPQQFDPETVQKIHDLILSRVWQSSPIGPVDNAPNPVFYAMTVYNGSERVHHQGFWSAPLRDTENVFNGDKLGQDQGQWAVPSEKSLPDGYTFLDDTFDQAARVAHPLSEKINLLK